MALRISSVICIFPASTRVFHSQCSAMADSAAFAQIIRQRVPGRARVAELGVAACGRHDSRREHRPLGGQRVERAVGVKVLVALVEDEAQRVLGQEIPVRVQVGNVVEPVADPNLHCRRPHAHVRRQLQRAEGARKADLLGVVDELVAQHHDGVPGHRLLESVDQLVRGRLVQVGAEQFRGKRAVCELRPERLTVKAHGTGDSPDTAPACMLARTGRGRNAALVESHFLDG